MNGNSFKRSVMLDSDWHCQHCDINPHILGPWSIPLNQVVWNPNSLDIPSLVFHFTLFILNLVTLIFLSDL